jgi:DnaJ like chaperone protein
MIERRMFGKVLGAVLGGVLGYVLGGPVWGTVLALVGAGAGHMLFDREIIPRSEVPPSREDLLGDLPPPKPTRAERLSDLSRRPQRKREPAPADQVALAGALCPLFIAVARSDGEVAQSEIRVVREFFQHDLGFGSGAMETVRVALKDAIAAPPVEAAGHVKAIRGQVKPAQRLQVVSALYEMALVDGDLKRAERDVLKEVVAHFNLSDEQLREITKLQIGDGAKYYAVLGLDERASDDDLRTTYRKLATEYHPDRAATLTPLEAESMAERFRAINEAWQELKKLRGL